MCVRCALCFFKVMIQYFVSCWPVFIFQPPHDKTNKMAFAPSEAQHPPSLISVFAARIKQAWGP